MHVKRSPDLQSNPQHTAYKNVLGRLQGTHRLHVHIYTQTRFMIRLFHYFMHKACNIILDGIFYYVQLPMDDAIVLIVDDMILQLNAWNIDSTQEE